MISKAEMDIAEDILRIYGLRNRDRWQKGHCVSAEWRYKNGSVVKLEAVSADWTSFKPEVFDIVDDVLHMLAKNSIESLRIIQIEYQYVSRYYKKPSMAARKKNQYRRFYQTSWAKQVTNALNDFWLLMQGHKNFSKYFNK